VSGELGYGNTVRQQPYAPHEYDAVIFDLRAPALVHPNCHYLPEKIKERLSKLVRNPIDEDQPPRGISERRWNFDEEIRARRRCKLIPEELITKASHHISFGPREILLAVGKAGTHVFLLLNPEWLERGFPNVVDLDWSVSRTHAEQVVLDQRLMTLLPELENELSIKRPLRFKFYRAPKPPGDTRLKPIPIKCVPIVYNKVGEEFGHLVLFGAGTIWALPAFDDNDSALALVLSRLDRVDQILLSCR
jgi:hypothetical protein